jgi:hypothetical protein
MGAVFQAADFCDTDTSSCNPAIDKHCQPPCTGQEAMSIVVGVVSVLAVRASALALPHGLCPSHVLVTCAGDVCQ